MASYVIHMVHVIEYVTYVRNMTQYGNVFIWASHNNIMHNYDVPVPVDYWEFA